MPFLLSPRHRRLSSGRAAAFQDLGGLVSDAMGWLNQNFQTPLVRTTAVMMTKPGIKTAPAPYVEPLPNTTPPPEAYRAPLMQSFLPVRSGRVTALHALGSLGGALVGKKLAKKHPIGGAIAGAFVGLYTARIITG